MSEGSIPESGITDAQRRYREEYLQSAHWRLTRAAALERAGYRCQVCNGPNRLDVHHRTYERVGAERPEDLTVLCRYCHDLFHSDQRVACVKPAPPKKSAPKKPKKPKPVKEPPVPHEKRDRVLAALSDLGPGSHLTREIQRVVGLSYSSTCALLDVLRRSKQVQRSGTTKRRAWTLLSEASTDTLLPERPTDKILLALQSGPQTLDELAAATALSVGSANGALSHLNSVGKARQDAKRKYPRYWRLVAPND